MANICDKCRFTHVHTYVRRKETSRIHQINSELHHIVACEFHHTYVCIQSAGMDMPNRVHQPNEPIQKKDESTQQH